MLKESFSMALHSIGQNKLRSILTLLGISIGVFSVIGVMTAIRTLESSVESGLNVFGTNTFVIQKWPLIVTGNRSKYRNRNNIDYKQYHQLKKRANLPVLISVSDETSARNVKYRNITVQKFIELIGSITTPNFILSPSLLILLQPELKLFTHCTYRTYN